MTKVNGIIVSILEKVWGFQRDFRLEISLKVPHFDFDWLLETRYVVDLVNITYLIGCWEKMPIILWIKVLRWNRVGINISHLSIPGIVVHGRRCDPIVFIFFFRLHFFSLGCFFCVVFLTFNKRYFHMLLPDQFLVCFISHFCNCYFYFYCYFRYTYYHSFCW